MDRCQTRVGTNLLGLVISRVGLIIFVRGKCPQNPTQSHPKIKGKEYEKEKPQLELNPNLTRIQIFGTHIFRGGLFAMKMIQMHK